MYIPKAKNQPEGTRQSDLSVIANGILYHKFYGAVDYERANGKMVFKNANSFLYKWMPL